VKCGEGLSNRASNIIRRYTDHMKFAACMAVSFITCCHILLHVYYFIYGCMFCMLLCNCANYVFLLLRLCIFIVVHVIFCVFCLIVVVLCTVCVCKCVMYY
jgi:hypothetical protein